VSSSLQQPTGKKTAALGIIDPDLLYTLERAAITIGITPRMLREEYVNTGQLMAMPMGRSYLIPGYAIHQLVMSNLEAK
jgi:hypothetical protein